MKTDVKQGGRCRARRNTTVITGDSEIARLEPRGGCSGAAAAMVDSRIEQVREAISAGAYDTDEVIDATIEAIVRALIAGGERTPLARPRDPKERTVNQVKK